MILHTREFTVDGYTVIMGHDRETGNRFFCQEVTENSVVDLPWYLQSGKKTIAQVNSIFWLKGGLLYTSDAADDLRDV
jgi:hypothetical protein